MVWRWALLVVLVTSPSTASPATRPTIPCDVTVDGRVELICVLFRLAGNREYGVGRISSYQQDVERYFGPYRGHEAVMLARALASEHGVGYDAPMSLAAHLSPLPELAERVHFDLKPEDLDTRLAAGPTRHFLTAARAFAVETKFDQFLASHHELYAVAVQRMTHTLNDHARLDWFEGYFGRPANVPKTNPQFHLVIGLQNGHCNYGARVAADDGDHLYCILGAWDQDEQGLPRFGTAVVPIVVHEFGHSYVNPIVDRHLDALRPAGQKIFAGVRPTMRGLAYDNWATMMRESVLRACVVRYRIANDGALAAAGEIAEQTLVGFTWTGALSQRLAEYEADRDRYPTFESFMPRIVEFFDEYTAKLP